MPGLRNPRAQLAALALRRGRGMGDPALAGLIGGIARVGAAVSQKITKFATTLLEKAGPGVAIATKSKATRVLATGAAGGIAATLPEQIFEQVRGVFKNGDAQYVQNAAGCPVAKVVDVAAHQRLIPIDPRTGRPRRRINVLNVSALSRATRRLGGFQKRAKRVEQQLAKIAPRRKARRKSQTTAIARCT